MNLSLGWFKSKKQEEFADLQIEEQKLKVGLLQRKLQKDEEVIEKKTEERPFKSTKLVNNVLTVVFNDGTVVVKTNSNPDEFEAIRKSKNESEILKIVDSGKKSEEEITEKKIIEGVDILSQSVDFEVKDNSVYLRGMTRTIPPLLVTKFSEVVSKYSDNDSLQKDEEYQGLKRFFMWCCLNPRAEVADKLYDFLSRNSFRITKQGFFAALRNVVTVTTEEGSNTALVDFISNAYNKVKAVWKKKPENYDVWVEDDGSYSLYKTGLKGDGIASLDGNLKDLYLDLPNMKENRFTDAYTHTFDIRVGKLVQMDPAKCSWSTVDCAEAGLHFTSDEIHYVGCGDTSVLILINPMKVVGIGTSKGRCYEYLPIMTVPREEATVLLHDLEFDTLELDEDYAIHELEGLSDKVRKGFVAETSKYTFNLPSVSTSEIESIVSQLEKMKNEISKRVSKI